jgi:hypothetical protein
MPRRWPGARHAAAAALRACTRRARAVPAAGHPLAPPHPLLPHRHFRQAQAQPGGGAARPGAAHERHADARWPGRAPFGVGTVGWARRPFVPASARARRTTLAAGTLQGLGAVRLGNVGWSGGRGCSGAGQPLWRTAPSPSLLLAARTWERRHAHSGRPARGPARHAGVRVAGGPLPLLTRVNTPPFRAPTSPPPPRLRQVEALTAANARLRGALRAMAAGGPPPPSLEELLAPAPGLPEAVAEVIAKLRLGAAGTSAGVSAAVRPGARAARLGWVARCRRGGRPGMRRAQTMAGRQAGRRAHAGRGGRAALAQAGASWQSAAHKPMRGTSSQTPAAQTPEAAAATAPGAAHSSGGGPSREATPCAPPGAPRPGSSDPLAALARGAAAP